MVLIEDLVRLLSGHTTGEGELEAEVTRLNVNPRDASSRSVGQDARVRFSRMVRSILVKL